MFSRGGVTCTDGGLVLVTETEKVSVFSALSSFTIGTPIDIPPDCPILNVYVRAAALKSSPSEMGLLVKTGDADYITKYIPMADMDCG